MLRIATGQPKRGLQEPIGSTFSVPRRGWRSTLTTFVTTRLPTALLGARMPAVGLAAACVFMPLSNRISPLILVASFLVVALPLVWLETERTVQELWTRVKSLDRLARACWLLIAGLLVWTVVGIPFAIRPDKAASAAVSLVALCVVGFLFVHITRPDRSVMVTRILASGAILSVAVVAAGLFEAMPLAEAGTFSLNRPVLLTSLVAWLVALWSLETLPGRRGLWVSIGVMATTVVLTLLSESQSAVFGLLAGFAGFLMARFLGRAGVIAVAVAAAVALLVFPFVVPAVAKLLPGDVFKTGFLAAGHSDIRLRIWEQYALTIQLEPLKGWGFYGSRYIPLETVKAAFPNTRLNELIYIHPHSVSVQVWVELGVFGAIAFSILTILVGLRLAQLDARRRAFALALYCAIFSVSMVSHGFFQSWWVAAIFMLVAAFPPRSIAETAR